tara:strand:+ start:147 stop:881 length:735 start_codon:yes stop_codon:yes gene_type:complete
MNVVVIGEACYDEFIYCKVDRICPEAPVPVLNPLADITNSGMSQNTANNIRSMFKEAKIDVIQQNEVITKTRYVESKSNQMFIRVDKGEDKIEPIAWNDNLVKKISDADVVIVSDYNKGFLTDKDITIIGTLSPLSILDSKRKLNDDMITDYTFVKLNEDESLNNPSLTKSNIITTLGAKGAQYEGKIFESPNPQQTIDVSGAGDTFTAAFIGKYFETKDMSKSIRFANKMASIVVSKRGVTTP